jgi:hypothetical protein
MRCAHLEISHPSGVFLLLHYWGPQDDEIRHVGSVAGPVMKCWRGFDCPPARKEEVLLNRVVSVQADMLTGLPLDVSCGRTRWSGEPGDILGSVTKRVFIRGHSLDGFRERVSFSNNMLQARWAAAEMQYSCKGLSLGE